MLVTFNPLIWKEIAYGYYCSSCGDQFVFLSDSWSQGKNTYSMEGNKSLPPPPPPNQVLKNIKKSMKVEDGNMMKINNKGNNKNLQLPYDRKQYMLYHMYNIVYLLHSVGSVFLRPGASE